MRLLIVDDDPLIRKSLSINLSRQDGIATVATAEDGIKATGMCDNNEYDAVLMDIRMPGMDGVAATKIIKTRHPHVKVMMLTTFDDRPNIQQALAAGADGYLLKTDKIAGISQALFTMLDGTSVLGTDVLKKLAPQENTALQELTQREQDITRLVAQGLTNKEIAERAFLSEGTVRNNIVVIMEKLNVSNRTQLGMMYYQR